MNRFFDILDRLDYIFKQQPSTEIVDEFVKCIRDNNMLSRYAFEHLNNVEWIKPLYQKGAFSTPPSIPNNTKYDVGDLYWPQSEFLARIVNNKSVDFGLITEILSSIDTNNYVVIHNLTQVANALPPEYAYKWTIRLTTWINKNNQVYGNVEKECGLLISKMAKSEYKKEALALAKALLAIMPDCKKGRLNIIADLPEPRPRFDIYSYKEILENNTKELLDSLPNETIEMLSHNLDTAIVYSLRNGEEQAPIDISSIWRPAIEDHPQNSDYDIKSPITVALRNALEYVITKKPDEKRDIINGLNKRRWYVFHRLGLHLLRKYPNGVDDIIESNLLDKQKFDEPHLRHEYMLLLQEQFPNISKAGRETIINWIETGPDIEEYRQRALQNKRPAPTVEQEDDYRNIWRSERYCFIDKYLPNHIKQQYDKWTESFGKPEHPDFSVYTTSWTGPTSPLKPEEIQKKSIEEIISYIIQWTPTNEINSPTIDGCARLIGQDVEGNTSKYLSKICLFKDVKIKQVYHYLILTGLRSALQKDVETTWDYILDYCGWVVNQRVGDWREPKKAVASLIILGLKNNIKSKIPIETSKAVWKTIEPLTFDSDPTQEEEKEQINFDSYTVAMNSVRGQAVEATIEYALWKCRFWQQQNKALLKKGLKSLPEVKTVLEQQLDKPNQAKAIYAIFGIYFPPLLRVDKEWVEANFDRMFPSHPDKREYKDAAWQSYLQYGEIPDRKNFNLLRELYLDAANKLSQQGSIDTNSRFDNNKLAQHIMRLYAMSVIKKNDPIMVTFFNNASDDLCGEAFEFAGRAFYRQQRKQAPRDKKLNLMFKQLWDWRRKNIANPSLRPKELGAFEWWFASEQFDDQWALDQLKYVYETLESFENPDRFVFDKLIVLAQTMPKEVFECLKHIDKRTTNKWFVVFHKKEITEILTTVINNNDMQLQQETVDYIHSLGERGYFDFRKILPVKNK